MFSKDMIIRLWRKCRINRDDNEEVFNCNQCIPLYFFDGDF